MDSATAIDESTLFEEGMIFETSFEIGLPLGVNCFSKTEELSVYNGKRKQTGGKGMREWEIGVQGS